MAETVPVPVRLFRAWLRADTTLNGLIGSRVVTVIREGETMPVVLMTLVTATAGTLDHLPEQSVTFQVDCYADDKTTAQDVANAVLQYAHTTIRYNHGTHGTLFRPQVVGYRDLSEIETDLARITVDLTMTMIGRNP